MTYEKKEVEEKEKEGLAVHDNTEKKEEDAEKKNEREDSEKKDEGQTVPSKFEV